jgi:tetratricopeptide (TPR) repeat protein
VATKKKQDTIKKVTTIIICTILVIALMVPVTALGMMSCSEQQPPAASEGETASDVLNDITSGDGAEVGATDLQAMYAASLEKHEAAVEADPSNYNNYELLGNVAMDWAVAAQQGELDPSPYTIAELYEKSIAAYAKRLELKPSPEVSVDKAIATFYNGDTPTAIAELEAFTAEDPYFAPAWANLGKFYESDEQYEKARESYQKALDSNPTDAMRSFAQQGLDGLPE